MDLKEKRAYIKKVWNISSGKKISEMCRRYFVSALQERKKSGKISYPEQPDIIKIAEQIFDLTPNTIKR